MKNIESTEFYKRISKEIHSDTSPVGIDAKKTHVLILMKLEEIQSTMIALDKRITAIEKP